MHGSIFPCMMKQGTMYVSFEDEKVMDLDALEGEEGKEGSLQNCDPDEQSPLHGTVHYRLPCRCYGKTLESNADWLGLKTLCLCIKAQAFIQAFATSGIILESHEELEAAFFSIDLLFLFDC